MQAFRRLIVRKAQQFKDDERGVGSTFAIFMAIICIGIGGLAIDVSNAWQMRQRLQTTADVAAHAGALMIVFPDVTGIKTTVSEALAVAEMNMPTSRFQNVLTAADITIGRWNTVTRQMTVDALTPPNAVEVVTRLDDTNNNPLGTFFLRLMGFSHWQISTRAVAMIDVRECHADGLVAGGKVDLTSNNAFYNGMCIHGQQGVLLRDNNFFDYANGVRISMPNPATVAEGGMLDVRGDSNIGAYESAVEGWIVPTLSAISSISNLTTNYSNPTYSEKPTYITNTSANPIDLRATKGQDGHPALNFNISMLEPNAVNIITCAATGGAKVQIPNNTTISNVIIVANCPIEFGEGSSVENAIFITSSTDANSFKGANNVRLGAADGCTGGGGAQFITPGGLNFASDMEYYGSQVIANGDVHLAAGVNGLSGISVQTEGDITVTANNTMGACSGGVDTVADLFVVHLVY